MGQSGSPALPEASTRPEFDPPATTPRGLEKKRDGFQTLPSDASPPPTSTTSSRLTRPAPPSATSPSSSAFTAPRLPATWTAGVSLATASRRHGMTGSSGKRPSSTRLDCRWPTLPTSSGSTHRPSPPASDAQASPCDPDEAGHRQFTPHKSGTEDDRARYQPVSRGRGARISGTGTTPTLATAAYGSTSLGATPRLSRRRCDRARRELRCSRSSHDRGRERAPCLPHPSWRY